MLLLAIARKDSNGIEKSKKRVFIAKGPPVIRLITPAAGLDESSDVVSA